MHLYRFYWFLLAILLGTHLLCASEGGGLFAPTDQPEVFFGINPEDYWVEQQDFISDQSFSLFNVITTSSHQAKPVFHSNLNQNNWSNRETEPRMIFRGQSPGLLNGFSGKVQFDYLTDFDQISRVGGHLFINVKSNFGIDTEAYDWVRKLDAGGSEKIQTGDLNLIYSLTQNSRIRIRSGAGVMFIKQNNGTDPQYGYNFTTALDVYLQYNLFFTGEMDWGKVDQEKMLHYRVSIGYYLRPVGLFIGYDSYKFDGIQELNGFLIGGDLRF